MRPGRMRRCVGLVKVVLVKEVAKEVAEKEPAGHAVKLVIELQSVHRRVRARECGCSREEEKVPVARALKVRTTMAASGATGPI